LLFFFFFFYFGAFFFCKIFLVFWSFFIDPFLITCPNIYIIDYFEKQKIFWNIYATGFLGVSNAYHELNDLLIFIFHEDYGSNWRYWLGTEESYYYEWLDYLSNYLGMRISFFFYNLFYDNDFFFYISVWLLNLPWILLFFFFNFFFYLLKIFFVFYFFFKNLFSFLFFFVSPYAIFFFFKKLFIKIYLIFFTDLFYLFCSKFYYFFLHFFYLKVCFFFSKIDFYNWFFIFWGLLQKYFPVLFSFPLYLLMDLLKFLIIFIFTLISNFFDLIYKCLVYFFFWFFIFLKNLFYFLVYLFIFIFKFVFFSLPFLIVKFVVFFFNSLIFFFKLIIDFLLSFSLLNHIYLTKILPFYRKIYFILFYSFFDYFNKKFFYIIFKAFYYASSKKFWLNLIFFSKQLSFFYFGYCLKFYLFFFDGLKKCFRLFFVYFIYLKYRIFSYDFFYVENFDNLFFFTKQPKRWEFVPEWHPILAPNRLLPLIFNFDEVSTAETEQDYYYQLPIFSNPTFSFFNYKYFFYRLPYYLNKNFFFLYDYSRYTQKFTAINPFIFPFLFIVFYIFISFFFFRDIFLLFCCLPVTENSLRYDWTVVSDKKNTVNFLTLDERIRYVDKTIFSNLFNYISSYKNISCLSLDKLDFNLNLRNDFVLDIDNFFLTSRDDFSNLFKFNTFYSGDIRILSPDILIFIL
jgi:hypothetical protein